MAVYKVIQDIEAEDKLLGPLGLKGLIYAAIAVICGFINFKLLLAGIFIPIKVVLILLFLGPMILFAVLASPLGRDQPTEVWLLSRIRFFLKPHLRIWDQAGIAELVTITAPKKAIRQLTKNLTQTEVQSRLQALATTLDSRGWATKHINVNLATEPDYFAQQDENDRLVATEAMVREVPEIDIKAEDDILDESNNPTAQNFQALMKQAEEERKAEVVRKLEEARQAEAKRLAEPPPVPRPAEGEIDTHPHIEKIHDLKPIYEIHRKASPAKRSGAGSTEVTASGDTGKLELANSGNDLSVASIAQLANRGGAAA